jgi:hypothetical protein
MCGETPSARSSQNQSQHLPSQLLFKKKRNILKSYQNIFEIKNLKGNFSLDVFPSFP